LLHQTRHLSDQELAHARDKFGAHLDRPWNDVEKEMIAVFYGAYPANLVAQALGRSRSSLLAYLEREHKRRPQCASKPTEGFCREWRNHIETRWDDWVSAGLTTCAADLAWRPHTRHAHPCRKCNHLHICHLLQWFLEPRFGDAKPRFGPLGTESIC